MQPLPIDAVLPELSACVARAGTAVLTAPTGAGKTTRVPGALRREGVVVMVEPRRVAARAAARRMAHEAGTRLGADIGYHVRFDRVAGPHTRILVCTAGVLLRRLQADPFLEGVDTVIFDEVHERSVPSDLALALTAEVRRDARPDLAVVAMSATLDDASLSTFLDDAPVVRSEGLSYPVTLDYLPRPDDRCIDVVVAAAVRSVLVDEPGDVLVFLPGVREIRRTAAHLSDLPVDVVPLYGDLPAAAQDRALSPGTRQRVVLATNVAEASVTVPGVTAVVDSGWVRQPHFDPSTELDGLRTQRISLASADQRAGRAGRTAPGRCLRLWTQREHAGLSAHDIPEIARVSVAGPLLQLHLWGHSDPHAFRWLQRPTPASLSHATSVLTDLGALADGHLTETGRAMAALPLHPRLARMVVEGARLGHAEVACTGAAILAERDPWSMERVERPSQSDLMDRVEWADIGRGPPGPLDRVRRIAWQLTGLVGRPSQRPAPATRADEALGRAVLAGWPDRVARRRVAGGPRALLVGRRGVTLHRSSAVHQAELFVALDVRPQTGDHDVHRASAVERGWLPVTTATEVAFDARAEQVRAQRVVRYRDLVLESHATRVEPSEAVDVLRRAAADELSRVVPTSDGWATLAARWGSVHHWQPEAVPALDDALLQQLLPAVCQGCRSFAELRRADWISAARQHLGWTRWTRLQCLAPERLTVPSGSQITLQYTPGEPPVLAVRMQELFGASQTPTVAEGRVPVRLHLLAPNRRPQQITDDLAGFWERTWPEVRKELRARYPKHAWPEDPITASPLRGVKRRR